MNTGLPSYNWTADTANVDPTTGRPRKRKRAAGSQVGTNAAGGGQASAPYVPPVSTQSTAPSFQSVASGGKSTGGGGGDVGGILGPSPLGGPFSDMQPDYQMILGSPQGGQQLWGSLLPGGTASNAAGFYGQNFDPYTLALASGAGAKGNLTNQDVMGFGQQLAGELAGKDGGGQFLNPVTMVRNIISLAAHATEKAALGGQENPLSSLASQDAYTQVNTLAGLLQGALASTLSSDVLQGFIAMIRRVGLQWADSQAHVPIAQRGKENVATALIAKLGPSLGMDSNTGPGGMATTASQRDAFI